MQFEVGELIAGIAVVLTVAALFLTQQRTGSAKFSKVHDEMRDLRDRLSECIRREEMKEVVRTLEAYIDRRFGEHEKVEAAEHALIRKVINGKT